MHNNIVSERIMYLDHLTVILDEVLNPEFVFNIKKKKKEKEITCECFAYPTSMVHTTKSTTNSIYQITYWSSMGDESLKVL